MNYPYDILTQCRQSFAYHPYYGPLVTSTAILHASILNAWQSSQTIPQPVAPDTEAADLDYPLITKWLTYCNQHACQGGWDLSKYTATFDVEGFVTIDQLVGPQVDIKKLSEWLQIGKGTADLILRYAEIDISLIKAGKMSE